MALTDEEWRLAEALAVIRQHGERATVHVAGRIGALAEAGDLAGVERWKQIAAAMDDLMRRTRQ